MSNRQILSKILQFYLFEGLEEDKEIVEDLIISAMNKAITKAQSESQKKMNAVTGGMLSGLKIPGM